jgi:hypothetical protein
MTPDPAELWRFLPLGYALSIVLETPVLVLGLSPRHSLARKLLAGVWLTACTYPIVVLVLPQLIWRPLGEGGYWPYVAVAEVFAPAAECLLFWLTFRGPRRGPLAPQADNAASRSETTTSLLRDLAAIIAANLCSFLIGMSIFNRLF